MWIFTSEKHRQLLLQHVTGDVERKLVLLINPHPRVAHEIHREPAARHTCAEKPVTITARHNTEGSRRTAGSTHVFWPASVGAKERETLWLLPKEKRCEHVSGGKCGSGGTRGEYLDSQQGVRSSVANDHPPALHQCESNQQCHGAKPQHVTSSLGTG